MIRDIPGRQRSQSTPQKMQELLLRRTSELYTLVAFLAESKREREKEREAGVRHVVPASDKKNMTANWAYWARSSRTPAPQRLAPGLPCDI